MADRIDEIIQTMELDLLQFTASSQEDKLKRLPITNRGQNIALIINLFHSEKYKRHLSGKDLKQLIGRLIDRIDRAEEWPIMGETPNEQIEYLASRVQHDMEQIHELTAKHYPNAVNLLQVLSSAVEAALSISKAANKPAGLKLPQGDIDDFVMPDLDKPLSQFVRISLPPPRNISPEDLKRFDSFVGVKSAGETFNLDAFK